MAGGNGIFGEDGGYANLRRFLDENIDKYEGESCRDDQPWKAVISPDLHWGELSPRLVLHEAFVGISIAKFSTKLAAQYLPCHGQGTTQTSFQTPEVE